MNEKAPEPPRIDIEIANLRELVAILDRMEGHQLRRVFLYLLSRYSIKPGNWEIL